MPRRKCLQFFAEVRADFVRAIHQTEPLHFMNRRHRRCQRHGVSLVSMAVRKIMVVKVRRDLCRSRAQSKWHIRRCNAFRRDENVRLNIPIVHRKPFSGASQAALDFIGNQQRIVPARQP